MKRLLLDDIIENNGLREGVIDAIKSGRIFIYPTDTVYGIGCNAENKKSVGAVRKVKQTTHSFSVIAPSMQWIRRNLIVKHASYLKKLPGPYTLIFSKKKKVFLSGASPGSSLGVRIPNHRFYKIVSAAAVPFITTSANISGKPTITSAKDIPKPMLERADFVIDAGAIKGNPSTVIDLTGNKPVVIRK